MNRRDRRRTGSLATKIIRPGQRQTSVQPRMRGGIDRKALLVGTALASTLLLGILAAPTPAEAVTFCPQPASPNPINLGGFNDSIICVNTEPRTGVSFAIALTTNVNPNHFIYLDNSGALIASNPPGPAYGIYTATNGPNSPIDIVNSGDIRAFSNINNATGIFADSDYSRVDITNSGDIWATSTQSDARAIQGFTAVTATQSPLVITSDW